jgi:PAS domain S-box-containing protein
MKKILIIEDDKILMANTADFLREEDFEVYTDSNGLSGLETALSVFPDLILCDISMPLMDGYQVYKELQKNSMASLIPFIFITAKSENSEMRLGMSMGADDYIIKPYSFEELLQSVNVRIERQEKLIKANEEKYRALTESSLTGVFMINENDKFDYTNEKFSLITGYSADELVNMGFNDLVLKDDQVEEVFDIKEYMKSISTSCTVEFRILSKKEERRHIELFGKINLIKNKKYFIGNIVDVTAKSIAFEQVLKAKEEAEIANRAKSEFLANISHEIRTPLNAIIGISELMKEDEKDIEALENIETILSSASDLLSIINDVLDISVIESGNFEFKFNTFSLRKVIESSIELTELKAKEKGLGLSLIIDDSCCDQLYGDETKLRQIIFNLVSNAVKFTIKGHVFLKVTSEKEENVKTTILFMVEDTGIGIPVEKHDLIFNAFQQADGSTTRAQGGTGLGLTISKRLVELMGGSIWLRSEPGKGSTFCFRISFEMR